MATTIELLVLVHNDQTMMCPYRTRSVYPSLVVRSRSSNCNVKKHPADSVAVTMLVVSSTWRIHQAVRQFWLLCCVHMAACGVHPHNIWRLYLEPMPCARRLKYSSAPAQRHVWSNAQIRHAHAKVLAPAPDLSPGQACHSTVLCQHPPPLSFLFPLTKASPTDPSTPSLLPAAGCKHADQFCFITCQLQQGFSSWPGACLTDSCHSHARYGRVLDHEPHMCAPSCPLYWTYISPACAYTESSAHCSCLCLPCLQAV